MKNLLHMNLKMRNNMKALNYIIKKSFAVIILIITCINISCNKENNKTPIIHYVRVTDPALADSTFTDAKPGTMIAVIGENLDGIQKIYINDQSISFNSNYGNSQSVIVTIPADIELTATNPELKSEIRIETINGIATYSFHIMAPGPQIDRYKAEKYPISPGDQIVIYGNNFYEIENIYISEEEPTEDGIINDNHTLIKEYNVNEEYSELTITMPEEFIKKGFLIVKCYKSNFSSIQFQATIPSPKIESINSNMPIVGEVITIKGTNFVDVSNIRINDEFDVNNYTVSESEDKITFILPQIPTKDGKISVTAAGGSTEFQGFLTNNSDNVCLNFDNKGGKIWGDYSYEHNENSNKFYSISGEISAWNWWWGQLICSAIWPSTNTIPGNTNISDLYLQFECKVSEPLNGAIIRIAMADDAPSHPLDNYIPTNDSGEYIGDAWEQCSIPLEKIVTVSTYQDFLNINSNQLGIYLINPGANGPIPIEIYFDNFRIIKK